jgi:hypothetical protein
LAKGEGDEGVENARVEFNGDLIRGISGHDIRAKILENAGRLPEEGNGSLWPSGQVRGRGDIEEKNATQPNNVQNLTMPERAIEFTIEVFQCDDRSLSPLQSLARAPEIWRYGDHFTDRDSKGKVGVHKAEAVGRRNLVTGARV